ncbi:MAG: CDP-diacylglycerol--glycerol-3-phosphate 3-phosphatidyltransferase [Clostridiales bacterium]|nr:CDP-diacylglycerol--glycerol-3-phosphate 3-phosphatidyltransferase [Clostridiales bacterium]
MNLPNKLSCLRIILVPVMALVFLLDFAYAPLIAVVIFALAAFTDFLDGKIARKYNMVTDLGKLLDPIADKLLVLFALFLVVEANLIPVGFGAFCGGIIIGRELLISAVRQIAASKGVIIQANIYGKIKTFVQDIALPLTMLLKMETIIVELFSQNFFNIYQIACWVLVGVATLLTLISGVVYLVQNKQVFSESK